MSTMSELTPATQAGPSNVQCVIDPQLLTDTSTALINYRLERTKANSEKKRKPEGKAAPTAAKKWKTTASNPTVPTNVNSLRCVCNATACVIVQRAQFFVQERSRIRTSV